MHSSKKPANYFLIAFLFATIFLVLYLVCLILIQDQPTRALLSDGFSLVSELLVAMVLFLAAKRTSSRSKRLGIAWGFIGLAILVFALGDTSWIITEVFIKAPAFPSFADFFYLLFNPLFIISIQLIPSLKMKRWEQIKTILDMSIIMLVATLGFWNYLIGPLTNSFNGQPTLEQILLVVYPIGDLLLLWSLLAAVYKQTIEIPIVSMMLLIGSVVVMITTDCLYAYQTMLGLYFSGNVVDIGFILSILLSGLAGIYQINALNQEKINRTFPLTESFPVWAKEFISFMPYGYLACAYILLIKRSFEPMAMDYVSMAILVGVVIGLVLIRQAITLFENGKLNFELKENLTITQMQADKLVLGNRELQAEITERKRIENQLSYSALHDVLTNLPNRSLFLDRLNRVIEYNKRGFTYPFSVLFLDLDSFKVINDSLGHTVGDQLLIRVGKRLKNSLRSSDTVARLGGDEFVILVENNNKGKSPLEVLNKLQQELSFPYTINGEDIYISASIGVVQNIVGYTHADDILRDADTAMYRAKQLGKSRYEVFDESMHDRAISRMALENEIRSALKNHEFSLYYQPIFQVKSQNLTGFEALIRWMHPKKGLLLPGEFLSVAEESGLIMPMGEWVINEACSKLKVWQARYPEMENITMSVNVSGKSLAQPNFVETIENALLVHGIDGRSIILEITENVLITNYMKANEIFKRLKESGIQIQIDDFGSGYSSLSYLQNLPISALKIDQSFIAEMSKSQRGQELVSSMISMAQKLGIDCIAEGIETREQLQELDRMMCPHGQGFLLSRPLQEDSAEKIYANGLVCA